MLKTGGFQQLSLQLRSLLITVFVMGASACKVIEAPGSSGSSTSTSSTVLASYTCQTATNNLKYNTLLSCQLTTGANCTSSIETFPNGSSSTCYTPVPGFENCLVSAPSWLYTAYTVQSITAGGYLLKRSLLGCSSNVCLCTPASTPADLELTIAALPATCNTTTCAPYVYQGSLNINGVPFALNTDLSLSATVPAISAITTPVVSASGVPNGFVLKVYSTPTCIASSLLGSGTVASGVVTVSGFTLSGGGQKNFYATFTNGSNTTNCSDTGVSYNQLVTPVLTQPSSLVVPSASSPAGSILTLAFSNSNPAGMSYTCTYDHTVDGTPGATACTSLGASFNTATGIFTWQPSATLNGKYEICVTGTNAAGSNSKCVGVFLVNASSYTLKTPGAVNIPAMSTEVNPQLGITGGSAAASFLYTAYSDSNCTMALSNMTMDASGNGTLSLTASGNGMKYFYGRFKDPVSNLETLCINTAKSYHLLGIPDLNHPTSRIFPGNEVKTGTAINLDFFASDTTGVSYSCKYDRVVDGTAASGSLCSSLSGATFNTSTGSFTWTPPFAAYGPYEICVTGTQAASPNPSASYCAVVDVVPNSMTYNSLAHYYDADFALANGGQNSNSNPTNPTFFRDLIGSVNGTLVNMVMNGASGWNDWNWPTNPYVVAMNADSSNTPYSPPITYYLSPSQLHNDYVDLSTSTNSSQSVTIDMWIYPSGQPITNVTGSVNLGMPWGSQVVTRPEYTTAGYVMNYYETANDQGLKMLVVDTGSGTHAFEAYIKSTAAGGTSVYCYTPTTYSYNLYWHHVTTVWNQATLDLSLYVDGVLGCRRGPSGNLGAGGGTPTAVSLPVLSRRNILGMGSDTNNRFVGQVAKTRIYNSANPAIAPINCNAEKQQFLTAPGICP